MLIVPTLSFVQTQRNTCGNTYEYLPTHIQWSPPPISGAVDKQQPDCLDISAAVLPRGLPAAVWVADTIQIAICLGLRGDEGTSMESTTGLCWIPGFIRILRGNVAWCEHFWKCKMPGAGSRIRTRRMYTHLGFPIEKPIFAQRLLFLNKPSPNISNGRICKIRPMLSRACASPQTLSSNWKILGKRQ